MQIKLEFATGIHNLRNLVYTLNNMKKSILLFFFTLIVSGLSFASSAFSNNEQNVIDKFWELRMNLTSYPDKKEAVEAIEKFRKENMESIDGLGKDAAAVFNALVLMEKYTYTYDFAGEDRANTREPFGNTRKQLKKLVQGRKDSDVNPYLFLALADVTSFYMSYSIADIFLHGMSVKKLQEKALEQDESFSPVMINYGQWFFYSPRIFGGSREKTLYWQNKAVETARTKAEEFFARLYYSQSLFEEKKFEESRIQLEEAEKLCPQSCLVSLLAEQNAMGVSLNEYNKKKSKLLKAADDYKKKNNIQE